MSDPAESLRQAVERLEALTARLAAADPAHDDLAAMAAEANLLSGEVAALIPRALEAAERGAAP